MKSHILFFTLIVIRIIFPPIIFDRIHPLYAMIIDEVVLDGIIAPHHLFKNYIPDIYNHVKYKKRYFDIPLDFWGFLNGLQPVLNTNNKFYSVFEGYRSLIITLFIWRMIGIILVYKLNSMSILKYFPNFYLPVYLSLSFCNMFKIQNIKRITSIMIVIFYIRELYLININPIIS